MGHPSNPSNHQLQSKIVEKAKQLASEPGSIAENDEKELQGQFSELLDIMRTGADDVDKEHVERIKKVGVQIVPVLSWDPEECALGSFYGSVYTGSLSDFQCIDVVPMLSRLSIEVWQSVLVVVLVDLKHPLCCIALQDKQLLLEVG